MLQAIGGVWLLGIVCGTVFLTATVISMGETGYGDYTLFFTTPIGLPFCLLYFWLVQNYWDGFRNAA